MSGTRANRRRVRQVVDAYLLGFFHADNGAPRSSTYQHGSDADIAYGMGHYDCTQDIRRKKANQEKGHAE